MNRLLRHIDRSAIIRGTALYLLVYAVLNTCGGIGFAFLGQFVSGSNPSSWTPGLIDEADRAAFSSWESLGGLSLVIGLLYLVSVPIFAAVAWGLWQRKSWSRLGAIVALGFTFLLSLVAFGWESVIWLIISAFGMYLFWTDAGIKAELTR